MTEQPDPSVPLSVVRSLVNVLLSFTEAADIIPVVDLDGVGWAMPSRFRDAEWMDREGAAHDIACVLSNRDGKAVSVISVSLEDGGSVSGECLRTEGDFRRFFGRGFSESKSNQTKI